jgi:hypothetical protein
MRTKDWTFVAVPQDEDTMEDAVYAVSDGIRYAVPAHCRECNTSTLVQGFPDGTHECLRCGENVDYNDVKFPTKRSELLDGVASALFPAVCAFCDTEMIGSYAKIGVIDCGGFGNCDHARAVAQ